MFAHLNPHSSDFGDICALYSPFLHQLTVQSSLFEPGRLRPCPSYSRRRDRIDLGFLRSYCKGGGVVWAVVWLWTSGSFPCSYSPSALFSLCSCAMSWKERKEKICGVARALICLVTAYQFLLQEPLKQAYAPYAGLPATIMALVVGDVYTVGRAIELMTTAMVTMSAWGAWAIVTNWVSQDLLWAYALCCIPSPFVASLGLSFYPHLGLALLVPSVLYLLVTAGVVVSWFS